MTADSKRALSLVVKGDRLTAARAAAERGIPFAFKSELDRETVGLTPSSFRDAARAWFAESEGGPPFPAGTLLLISEVEVESETERDLKMTVDEAVEFIARQFKDDSDNDVFDAWEVIIGALSAAALQAEPEDDRLRDAQRGLDVLGARCDMLAAALRKIVEIEGSTGGPDAMVREFKNIALVALAQIPGGNVR